MVKVDVAACADVFHQEIKKGVQECISSGWGRPKLVGFLANNDSGAAMYARWTGKACERDGVDFELRHVERTKLEEAVVEANDDNSVHGIIVYYPVFGGPIDDYIRDVISIKKDVEGLNHRYRYSLYHNIRTLDNFGNRKCVLPCTPLAILKILEHLGAYDRAREVGNQLADKVAVVFNRSEVVGRPLAAMLANDGATVYSIDVTGMLEYKKGRVHGTIKVNETALSQDEALRSADIVIAGVPVKSFSVDAAKLKPGCLALNFAPHSNFSEGVEDKCTFVPAIGKVTIAMLERNLIRLQTSWANDNTTTTGAALDSAGSSAEGSVHVGVRLVLEKR